MSMREAAAEVNGFSLLRKVLYDEPWDADVLRGCVCDPEWEGYDCSQRRCPRGDDPLTAGQSDEVQLLSCSCPNDECVGDMTLSFYGQASPRINATSVLSVAAEQPDTLASGLARGESVEAKLETIRPLDGVLVEPNATDGPIGWHGSAPLCAPASQGGAVSRITFNEHGGDVPALEVTSAVFGRDNVTGALVAANVTLMHDGQGGSVRGSTEYEVCSGRGVCDHLLGDCLCFDNYFASDGDGQPGSRADCGFASVNISDCPNVLDRCSARGVCDSQRVINGSLLVVDDYAPFVNETFLYKCNCYHGYEGGDCSIRECWPWLPWPLCTPPPALPWRARPDRSPSFSLEFAGPIQARARCGARFPSRRSPRGRHAIGLCLTLVALALATVPCHSGILACRPPPPRRVVPNGTSVVRRGLERQHGSRPRAVLQHGPLRRRHGAVHLPPGLHRRGLRAHGVSQGPLRGRVRWQGPVPHAPRSRVQGSSPWLAAGPGRGSGGLLFTERHRVLRPGAEPPPDLPDPGQRVRGQRPVAAGRAADCGVCAGDLPPWAGRLPRDRQ